MSLARSFEMPPLLPPPPQPQPQQQQLLLLPPSQTSTVGVRSSRRSFCWGELKIRLKLFFTLWTSMQDVRMLSVGIAYFVTCSYVACLANAYADQDGVNFNSTKTAAGFLVLKDVGLDLMAPLKLKFRVPNNLPEYFLNVQLLLIFLRVFSKGRKSFLYARRFFVVTGTVYLIRAPTTILTVLPYAFTDCVRAPETNIAYYALLLLANMRVSCGDVFFSGHTIVMTMATVVWYSYSKVRWLAAPVALINFLGCISMLIVSYHYTIDILFSIFVLLVVHNLYLWTVKGKIFEKTVFAKLLIKLDNDEKILHHKYTEVRQPEFFKPAYKISV